MLYEIFRLLLCLKRKFQLPICVSFHFFNSNGALPTYLLNKKNTVINKNLLFSYSFNSCHYNLHFNFTVQYWLIAAVGTKRA